MTWNADAVAQALSDGASLALKQSVKTERSALPTEGNKFKLTMQTGEEFWVNVLPVRLGE